MINWVRRRIIVLHLLFLGTSSWASLSTSIFQYNGAATSASLLNIIKGSIPDLGGYYITSIGLSQEILKGRWMSLEWESQISRHFELASSYSVGAAWVLRWLAPPWDRLIPGSFGIGNGLSYSTEYLGAETSAMGRTSKLLYHVILEFEFRFGMLGKQSPMRDWGIFFRDHHRSGMFGAFDGVIGGSDFICIGMRYHLP